MSEHRWTIWRYYAYCVSLNNGFFIPVGILYIQEQGLGLDVVGFTQGAFLFAVVASEIPTGYLGDRIGRRRSLILGSVLVVVVMVAYPFADSLLEFVVLFVVWAFGSSFRSGTAEAWLYELLKSRLEESEFARINGRGRTFTLVASAATAAAAGALFTLDPSLPFFANAALIALGVPVLISLPAVQVQDEGDPFRIRDAARSLRVQINRPSVRWLVLYVSLFFALFEITRAFEQPAAVEVGMPVALIGMMYSVFMLASAGASSIAGSVNDRFGTGPVFVLLAPLIGLAYLSALVVPQTIVIVFFVVRSVKSMMLPIQNQYFNDRLADTGRATVLSGIAMTMSLAGGVAQIIGGALATSIEIIDLLIGAGVAITVAAVLVWVLTSPVRTKSDSTKTESVPTE